MTNSIERTLIIEAADMAEALAGDHWDEDETPSELDALVAVVASILGHDAAEFVRKAYHNSVAEYQAEWRDYDDCPLDGDHGSALASAGWGTDEDYGCLGDEDHGCFILDL